MLSNKKSYEDLQDYHSEISIGMFRAASYYKRQTFIENVFNFFSNSDILQNDDLIKFNKLKKKWEKKSSFLEPDEDSLIDILEKYKNYCPNAPNYNSPLKFDNKFNIYCKAIIWNTSKSLGQHISKENKHKNREISLDEWKFLEGGDFVSNSENNISYTPNNCSYDFEYIRNKINDQKTIDAFDIITDSCNYDSIFKKSKKCKNNNIKMNVIRKSTKMSYPTIKKKIKDIKKIIKEEFKD